jgi:hypothetical protein
VVGCVHYAAFHAHLIKREGIESPKPMHRASVSQESAAARGGQSRAQRQGMGKISARHAEGVFPASVRALRQFLLI